MIENILASITTDDQDDKGSPQFDELDGWEELDSDNKKKIVTALGNGHVEDSDWKGVSATDHLFSSPMTSHSSAFISQHVDSD